MNKENFIVIKGGSYNEIKKALRQWIEIYSDELEANIKFDLFKTGNDSAIIAIEEGVNNENFNFLINYLCYPEGIDYKIKVEGYTTAADAKLFPKDLLNKRLLIYIDENDKEYDNVFAVTEDNEAYLIDFGGTVSRLYESKMFKLPNIDFDLLPKPERIILNKTEIEEKRKEKSLKSIDKRFRIIVVIIGLVVLINTLSLTSVDPSSFAFATLAIGFGISGWLVLDYKLLQISRYYNYCLLIGVAIFFYNIIANRLITDHLNGLIAFGAVYPLSLLVIQKPLRLIFIRMFKREPIVEKPAPSFLDFVYTMFLLFALLGIPVLIAIYMK